MKLKLSLYLLAVSVATSLVGCGGTSSNSTTASSMASNPSASPSTTTGSGGTSGMGSGSGSSSGSGSGSGGSGSGGSGSAQSATAFAYVGTTGRSTAGIYGFAVMPDGTATSVPGSPASGPGSYVVSNSAFAFATDASNLASYTRGSDGSLTASSSVVAVPNAGTPTTYLIQAMSLDHSGQTLYAMENAGSDDLYYYFFNVANGSATKIGQIGPNVEYASPLVFSPDNVYAYGFGCFHLDATITGFHRNSDGSLSPFNTNVGMATYAGSSQFYCPQAEAVSATGYLAVADTVNGATTATTGLGIYKINSDGTVSLVQSSVQQTALSQITALNFDSTGTFLAAAGNSGIQMFQLMPGGGLSALGGAQSTGSNYLGVEWDTQNHVYAISSAGLTVFTNAGGTLTPASGSPHAAGAAGSLAVLSLH